MNTDQMLVYSQRFRGVSSPQSVLHPLLTGTGPSGSSALRLLVLLGHFLLFELALQRVSRRLSPG